MNAPKTKIILVFGAIVLFVLLYFAPKIQNSAGNGSEPKLPMQQLSSIDSYVAMAEKKLDPKNKSLFDAFAVKKQFDSLVLFWNKLKRPDIAAFYFEKKAEKENNAESWFKAGNKYYFSIKFIDDKDETAAMFQSAFRCYENAVKIKPGYVDAQIMSAACLVEGTNNPMEGIAKLKEIEKTDSLNPKLNSIFAEFSVKSGQTEKAISRYNKILRADSSNIEVFLYLAQLYEQTADTIKAVKMLENFRSKTTDVTAKLEIGKYIEQLKRK
ncbi:MAG: hypothetical protein JSU07_13400 [Bacteroidetes bacterium]|nr:hypothetical protein [Bacteroidota bacterium]